VDVNHRVLAGILLMSYCALAADFSRGHAVMQTIEPLIQRQEVGPLHRIWWRTRVAYFYWSLTEYRKAIQLLKEAERLAETHGLAGLRAVMSLNLSYQLLCAVGLGDHRAADAFMKRSEEVADTGRRMHAWHKLWARVQGELGKGNSRPAFESPEVVVASFETGMVYVQVLSLIAHARGLAEHGNHEQVTAQLRQATALLEGSCFQHLLNEVRLTNAYSLFKRNDKQAAACIEEALRCARQSDYTYHMRWCSTMPDLCAEALRTGIEQEYVRKIIAKYGFRPPSRDVEEWAWPVKVFTMGRFELYINGERVEFSGKAPKRPLGLLKALIAFGGEKVPEERLMDALWPDDEADSAKALDITVLRLRKLLQCNEALLVAEGKITFNGRFCWVDTWALEKHLHPLSQNASVDGKAVLGLYRGNFLPAESDEPWAAKPREMLRAKFVRAVEAIAEAAEKTGRWEEAIALFNKGLEADDLVESFYQGLMRCYQALGRHAEAMIAYRRLRHLLSVVLGIAPSETSQALARALQRDNPTDRLSA
jgi:DNA-binding SARP family transcriptional activator